MSLTPLEGLGANTSLQQLEKTYDKWSGKYETDMISLGYHGPGTVAKIVRNYEKLHRNGDYIGSAVTEILRYIHRMRSYYVYKRIRFKNFLVPFEISKGIIMTFLSRGLFDNDGARILDMAAGTGMAGQELRKLGFTSIHASDMSTQILEQAKQKGVYDKVFRCRMGEDSIEGSDESYDCITIVGCFSVPVPVKAFQELNRVLSVGGYLVVTFRPDVWTDQDIYQYKQALNSAEWRHVSESLEDFHGVLNQGWI